MLKKTLIIATLAATAAIATLSTRADAADPLLGALIGGGIGAAIGPAANRHNRAAATGARPPPPAGRPPSPRGGSPPPRPPPRPRRGPPEAPPATGTAIPLIFTTATGTERLGSAPEKTGPSGPVFVLSGDRPLL